MEQVGANAAFKLPKEFELCLPVPKPLGSITTPWMAESKVLLQTLMHATNSDLSAAQAKSTPPDQAATPTSQPGAPPVEANSPVRVQLKGVPLSMRTCIDF